MVPQPYNSASSCTACLCFLFIGGNTCDLVSCLDCKQTDIRLFSMNHHNSWYIRGSLQSDLTIIHAGRFWQLPLLDFIFHSRLASRQTYFLSPFTNTKQSMLKPNTLHVICWPATTGHNACTLHDITSHRHTYDESIPLCSPAVTN